MRTKVSILAMAFLISGCGGSAPSGKAADEASGPRTKGQQCLDDADAPRDPKPDAPSYIAVSHILVRHAGLRRPEGASRTPEEACLRALAALEALKKGAPWEDVVEEYSDAAGNGGLGRIRRDDVDSKFADAAFSLEVDELSYVVETPRGFHVILRTD